MSYYERFPLVYSTRDMQVYFPTLVLQHELDAGSLRNGLCVMGYLISLLVATGKTSSNNDSTKSPG